MSEQPDIPRIDLESMTPAECEQADRDISGESSKDIMDGLPVGEPLCLVPQEMYRGEGVAREPSNAELIADVENTFVLLKPSKARLLAARLKEAEANFKAACEVIVEQEADEAIQRARNAEAALACADAELDRLRSELEAAKTRATRYSIRVSDRIEALKSQVAAAAEREKRMRLVLEGIIRDCESCDGTGMEDSSDRDIDSHDIKVPCSNCRAARAALDAGTA